MADLVDIIKYEGDNTTFIWKHPIEDFNTGTQLIVHESQEAVFFMNGQALDLFGPGRHELTSQNIPLIGKFFRRATDDKTPFRCSVWFINKTEQMAIKWGTDSKIEYVEPTYKFPLKIGASGEMSLLAEDSRKLLVKLVGTERNLTQASLVVKVRAILMTRVKTYMANLIREKGINIFSIDEHLTDMSESLRELLMPDFADYGVRLAKFWVMNIVKPEEDRSYQKFRELHFRQYADVAEAQLRQQVGVIEQQTQAQRMVIEAQGIAQKRAMEGFTYQEERGFEVAEKVASNEAVGQMSNLGIGLGVISGVGGTVGGTVGGMMQNSLGNLPNTGKPNQTAGAVCPGCNTALPQGAKFCLTCGKKVEPVSSGDLICPACGKATPKGKFCAECGAPLITICSGCGKEVPQGAKFCPDCGQPQ